MELQLVSYRRWVTKGEANDARIDIERTLKVDRQCSSPGKLIPFYFGLSGVQLSIPTLVRCRHLSRVNDKASAILVGEHLWLEDLALRSKLNRSK